MNSFTHKDQKVTGALLSVAYHRKMTALAMWLHVRLSNVVVTSGYRKDDLGIAGMLPCRHLDIRAWIYDDAAKVADDINDHWVYDKSRPRYKCALYHARCPKCGQDHRYVYQEHCQKCGQKIKFHWHLHLQVHQNTKYLGG